MKRVATPVTAMIRRLLARGLSMEDSLIEAAEFERATAIGSGSSPEQREKWRKRAKEVRTNRVQMSTETKSVDSMSSLTESKTLFKEEEAIKTAAVADDWPKDFEAAFWDNFPKKRRYDKPQVMALLVKLRKEKTVIWAVLFSGLLRYVSSEPGDYAKAPLPWLRGHRWEGDYGQAKRTEGGNSSKFSGSDNVAAAATRRFGGGARNDATSRPADAVRPSNGVGADRPGAPGGARAAFDLDLRAGPGR